MSIATLATFLLYFMVVLTVGLYGSRKNKNIEDYLLGGAKNIWIAVGLFVGTILNWVLVAGRLRLYTQKTNAITFPRFLEERFGDPTGLLRSLSAVVILVFFTIYASSGLVAAGKLFESTFGTPYWKSVLIGGLVTIGYTLLGGYFAVCWTDVIQGLLMVNRAIHPLLAGVMLAAIMAAIMSTIDSQLLVSSSALTEDLPRRSSAGHSVRRTAFWGSVLQQFDEVTRERRDAARQAAAPQVGYGTGAGGA